MTESFLATATMAFLMPFFFTSFNPHFLNREVVFAFVKKTNAAS